MLTTPLLHAAEPSLVFSGVNGALLDNLRTGLSLSSEPCTAPAWRIKRLFREADVELDRAARALGYYHLTVQKRLQFEKGCWQVRFKVIPGQPTRLSTVDINIQGEAQHDPDFRKLLKETPVRIGAQLNHGTYEALKRKLEELAAERGYFDGHFTVHELKVFRQENRATIKLRYDSGQRYRIGALTLNQTTYAPELLQRYLKIRSGDPYDAGLLAAMHRALADSGYFEQVSIKPDYAGAANGKIDLRVELTPSKRIALRLGIGAATDTGPRLSIAFDRRRLNRYGHRLESKLLLSQVESSLGLEYLIPLQRPHIDQFSLRTGYRRLDTDSSTSNTTTLGLRTVGKRGDWSETRYLDWVSERSRIANESSNARLLVPGISWSRTRADNLIRPRKGSRLNLEIRGAEKSLLSDASFVQLLAAGKWIRPLGKGRMLLRGETGLSLTPDFSELPASYRFFAGGDQSVRGYGFEALGPRNADGKVIGGRYRLTASLEYEYPVKENWSAALFVDAGNAFDSWSDGVKSSAGIGLRWHSPVGPIRLDLAIPEDQSADQYRIHFSMGSDL